MSVSIVVLMGPPGSGKGTQAKGLADKFPGWVHISTGDLFRGEISSNSALGSSVKTTLAKGKLVSDELTNQIFRSQVEKIMTSQSPKVLMLDGYPRTSAQAGFLMNFCLEKGLGRPHVVEFFISEDGVVTRLQDRLINPRTGRIYHKVTNPPKKPGICDDDGGALVQRPDDRPETIRARYRLYQEQRDGIQAAIGGPESLRQIEAIGSPTDVERTLVLAIAPAVT